MLFRKESCWFIFLLNRYKSMPTRLFLSPYLNDSTSDWALLLHCQELWYSRSHGECIVKNSMQFLQNWVILISYDNFDVLKYFLVFWMQNLLDCKNNIER